MSIKIYAPADGTVNTLDSLDDGIFSKKVLGDGFVFETQEKTLYSPVDNGHVSLITDTGHALFFELENNLNILMHIGIETVTLGGLPFNVLVKNNDKLYNSTKLVDVDWKLIKQKALDPRTPITIDNTNYNFVFKTQIGSIKKGELIGEFTNEKHEIIINEETAVTYFNQKTEVEIVAAKINKYVGYEDNYTSLSNCNTRLRFIIKKPELVREEQIKRVQLVKGVVWNDKELQIVLGNESANAKDAIIKQNNDRKADSIPYNQGQFSLKKVKEPGKGFSSIVSQIMIPLIPPLIAGGLMMALVSVLQQTGAMPHFKVVNPTGQGYTYEAQINPFTKDVLTPGGYYIFNNADGLHPPIGWALLYIGQLVVLKSFTVYACITTARYLNYNQQFSAAIGMMITAPAFMMDCSNIDFTLIHIKAFDTSEHWNALANIKVEGQGLNIIVGIVTIFFAKHLDDWVKTWMPNVITFSVRPFIILSASFFVGMFILGPIWSVISGILGALISFTKGWHGAGIALYAVSWQIAVCFGFTTPLGLAVTLTEYLGNLKNPDIHAAFSYFSAGQTVGAWGQMGAVVAIMIMTKDRKVRRECGNTLPIALFGITEPMVFGITLPRILPFITATIGDAVGALFAGFTHVTMRIPSGSGLFEYIGYFPPSANPNFDTNSSGLNGSFMILSTAIAFVVALPLTMLLYKDSVNEISQIKKISNQVKLFINLNLKINNKILDEQKANDLKLKLNSLNEVISEEDKKIIKELKKEILKYSNLVESIRQLDEKNSINKSTLFIKGRKLVETNKTKQAVKVMKRHNDNSYQLKIDELTKIKEGINIEDLIIKINNVMNKIAKELDLKVANLSKEFDLDILTKLNNNYKNGVNKYFINHDAIKKLDEEDIKDQIYQLKIKLQEQKLLAKRNG